ncbi:srh-271, partial [Pristionchus pacificus]
ALRKIRLPEKALDSRMFIYLSLETQGEIFLYIRILFCFSSILHTIALLCLLKQTPPNQATVRKYLIYIQVLLVLSDVHMGVFFEPIPLFPVLAGYCIGVACQLGVPVQVQTGITVLLIANVGVSVLLCVIFRHQSLLPDNHRLKMGTMLARAIHWSLLVGFSVPPIMYSVALQDPVESERQLEEHPELSWIRGRGPWLVQERSPELTVFFVAIVIIILIGFELLYAMYAHMFYILKTDYSKRSTISSAVIHKSLVMMCIQLVIPLFLLILPAVVIYIGLAVEDLITFETSFFMFLLIHLHPIGHNIILLSVTPTYRNFIARFIRIHVFDENNSVHTARIQTAPSSPLRHEFS